MTPTETVISRFKAFHGDLYDYSNVNYVNSTTKVEIVCLKHGSFFKTVASHCKGRGCPVCSQSNTRYTLESLLSKFESVHSDTYDYSKVVFTNVRSKVTIICKQHGEFEQRADQHIQGMGCLECSIQNKIGNQICYLDNKSNKAKNSSVSGTNSIVDGLVLRFNAVHNDLYDYSLITKFENAKSRVKIICKTHGIFEQRITNHLQGSGCQICGLTQQTQVNTASLIAEFKQVHGDVYDYSDTVYVNFKTKVAIKCRKHGVFMQRTRCHASGSGCPFCRSSKGESRIREFFKLNNIDFVEQYPICKNPKTDCYLRADFYLPHLDICIEYDGRQHFKVTDFFGGESAFEELQYRDGLKTAFCNENGIKLIRISYKEYAKINQILSSAFKKEVIYEQ